jgi:hypothetical protein
MNADQKFERYDFTEPEIDQLGRELGQQVARLGRLRGEKTLTAKDYKEQIDACEERCAKLSDCITTGFEMRAVSAQRPLSFSGAKQ